LCDAVTPGVVNWEIFQPGETDESKEQNAKYVLSVARKMGCAVFLLWEDVVQVTASLANEMQTTQTGTMVLLPWP
jgi:hypothetical protein